MRILIVSCCLLLSACTMVAPAYQPLIQNTQTLKRASLNKVNVGEITDNKALNKLSMRGSSLVSPYDKSYGKYIVNALKLELTQAKIYDDKSDISISGELISNEIDVSGFSIGEGEISVKFAVKKGSHLAFEKLVAVKHQWESSFMGGIAIPNGANNYPVMVQKLFTKLIDDPEFIAALKL
jgi:hypothetical protein